MDLSLCLQSLQTTDENIFKDKTVTILGLGGVGSRVASMLVRHGINVRLIDKERFYEREFPRQSLFREEDISKFKAKQAKKLLEQLDSNAIIKTFHEELTKDNAFLLKSDVIVDTTNSPKITAISNEYAQQEQVAYISSNCAGMTATMLTYIPGKVGGCANCAGDAHNVGTIKKNGMFSPLSDLMAGLVGSQILHYLAGKEVNNQLISVNLEPYNITSTKVESIKGCPVCSP